MSKINNKKKTKLCKMYFVRLINANIKKKHKKLKFNKNQIKS